MATATKTKMASANVLEVGDNFQWLASLSNQDKNDTAKLIKELEDKEKCESSFYEFFKYYWDTVVVDDFKDNWHIKYLCDELQIVAERIIKREPKEYDLVINISPGTSKSTIASKLFPVWLWVKDPGLRIISSSFSASASTPHSVKSRECMKSDKFIAMFGDKFQLVKDNEDFYSNDKQGERISTSNGGSITSKHAHIIIVDDPHKPPTIKKDGERVMQASLTEMLSDIEWYNSTLSTRKVDKKTTPTIYIMQRLHQEDLTANLLEQKSKGLKVKHICIPSELTEDLSPVELKKYYVDNLFDPVRLDKDDIKEQRIKLGTYGYAGQFLQTPAPPEGGILKRDWFKIVRKSELPEEVFRLPRNFYSDTAYGLKNSDNSATGVCSNWNGKLIVWLISAVNLSEPDFRRYYIELLNTNVYTSRSRCLFEPKATGHTIIQNLKELKVEMDSKTYIEETYYTSLSDLRSETIVKQYKARGIELLRDDMNRLYYLEPKFFSLNVFADKPPKDSKETRVTAISASVEAGNVWFVEGGWNSEAIDEACIFPNGKNDDRVDVIEMMARNEISKVFRGFKNTNITTNH